MAALRNERLSAARDGARIKEALERALVMNPALYDAYFGIGLYRYLAERDFGTGAAPPVAAAPAWRRPRARTPRHAPRPSRGPPAHRRSGLSASPHLSVVEEDEPERAVALLRGLRDRHLRNPLFWQLIAEVEDVYLQDATASRRSWELLLDAARAGRVSESALAETRARLGIARQLDITFETDAAVPHLRAVIEAKATAPAGALAQAYLALDTHWTDSVDTRKPWTPINPPVPQHQRPTH